MLSLSQKELDLFFSYVQTRLITTPATTTGSSKIPVTIQEEKDHLKNRN